MADSAHRPMIHEMCRTERYFTATVIPTLLMYDNLKLLPHFLDLAAKKAGLGERLWNDVLNWQTVDIVTEFDFNRDRRDDDPDRQSIRPDILIATDCGDSQRTLISMECKFFTRLDVTKVAEQISKQQRMLVRMQQKLGFSKSYTG